MANIFSISVVDCANAAKDYNNFGHYVYLVDNANEYGIGQVNGDIQQMTINCYSGDCLYFWTRGILPSDMPTIKSMDCSICNIYPSADIPGTWQANVIGTGNKPLNCELTMGDRTNHSFVININAQ